MKPTITLMPASGTGSEHEPSPIASPLAAGFPLLGFTFSFLLPHFFTFPSSFLFFYNVILLQGCEDPQIPTTVRGSLIRVTKPPKPLSCRLAAPINKLGNIYHQYCSSSTAYGWQNRRSSVNQLTLIEGFLRGLRPFCGRISWCSWNSFFWMCSWIISFFLGAVKWVFRNNM
jgi:hypothetical protein